MTSVTISADRGTDPMSQPLAFTIATTAPTADFDFEVRYNLTDQNGVALTKLDLVKFIQAVIDGIETGDNFLSASQQRHKLCGASAMTATQSLKSTFTAIGSGTAEALEGGYYFIAAAWANKSGATLNLQLLGPDGTTQLPLLGTAMSNSGVNAVGYLPAGQYSFIAGGTFGAGEKITAAVSSVPLN